MAHCLHRRDFIAGLGASAALIGSPTIVRAQSSRTLRIGQIFPKTHPYHRGLVKFAEEVAARTNGAIKIEVFSDAQLGGEVAMVQGMRTGTIDGGIAAAGTFGQTTNQRKFYVLDMPFLFKDHSDLDRWADGPLANELRSGVPESSGVHILAFGTAGFSQILNSKRPIIKPEDLKGLKMRVWQSRSAQVSFEITGMTATPMPYGEVFTSLQQGVVDGLVNTLTTLYQTKMHEVAKHLAISNHIVAVMPIMISERVFQSFGAPERSALSEGAVAAAKYWRGLYPEEDRENLRLLKENGCMVTQVDRDAFREFARPGYDRFVELIGEPGAKELVEKFKNFSA
jgi:tripartite ATP-independent transporter DctP family solute receptor